MKVYTVRGCSNHCEAYMHERDTEDAVLAYRPHVEDSYVHLPDHQAALAAKDTELASLQRELDEARKNAFNLSSLIERIAIKLGIVREPFEPVSDEVAERLAIRGAGWDIEGMEGLILDKIEPCQQCGGGGVVCHDAHDYATGYFPPPDAYRPCEQCDAGRIKSLQEDVAAKDAELAKANLALDGFKRVYETQTAAILEWEARVKAKDAALAELLDAMAKARACFHQESADDILDEAIAKHRPEEGADNGPR